MPGDGSIDSLLAGLPPAGLIGGKAITFGRNANAEYHAIRHLEGVVDATKVKGVIDAELRGAEVALQAGLNKLRTFVDNVELQYNAYMFEDGSVNVGRIDVVGP